MAHIAHSNFSLCSKIGDVSASENNKIEGTSGKEKIVAALKDSFQFCHMALEKADDSKLGDEVTMFGGRKAPRAAALIATHRVTWEWTRGHAGHDENERCDELATATRMRLFGR